VAEPAPPSDDIEDRDPGLARERTDLAWTRTAISYVALGALMLHTSPVGIAVIGVAGAVWGLGQLSARQAHATAHRRLSHHLTVRLVTAATTLVSLLALLLAVLAPGVNQPWP
jgi:uncharacterized membrane protein YidH (DUF202 family)